MKQKTFNNVRFQLKGDSEENLQKASGFVPLDKELVMIKPDDNNKYARLMVGDGVNSVGNLLTINPQPNWNQEDSTQPDYIRNKPEIPGGGTTITVGGVVVDSFDADTKVGASEFQEYQQTVTDYYLEVRNNVKEKTAVSVSGTVVETFDADTKLAQNSLHWEDEVLCNSIDAPIADTEDYATYQTMISPFYISVEQNGGGLADSVTLGTESVLVSRASGEETIINWPIHNTGEQYGVVTLATTDDVDEKASRLDLITASNTGDGFIPCMKLNDDGIERRYNVHGAYIGAYTIPLRVAGGRLHVGDPVEPSQATTKKYVDDLFASILGGDEVSY